MAIAESDLVKLAIKPDPVVGAVARAHAALLAEQLPDGCWSYPLEADCTIPAEYVLLLNFEGDERKELEERIGCYLRSRQGEHGGWPLYEGGAFDLSCTIKVYYALKLIGDDPEAEHMRRARRAILDAGGAARANVFTRITLALFEQVPWRAVPFMPPELMLLPPRFLFHVSKVAYWSRTVIVPLLVLYAHKPAAANPRRVDVQELFTVPPERERRYFPVRSALNRVILGAERVGRRLEWMIPDRLRRLALTRATEWMSERCRGEGGLGAIFPAMVNAYLALQLEGYGRDHPLVVTQRRAIDDLIIDDGEEAWVQPCVSPVWDTGLACLALLESSAGGHEAERALQRALEWLRVRQLVDEPGDWRWNHPDLAGGGWAFQFENAYYPDLDDTAVVAWAMHAFDSARFAEPVRRSAEWIRGMQSRNGGFAAFDSDNTCTYLNEIPFADHDALLDPPTSDVSARCVTLLGLLDRPEDQEVLRHALAFLRDEQEANGSWFGRWGSNYIYGTWSALTALAQVGDAADEERIQRGADWLVSVQHADGGWGEHNDSYVDPERSPAGDESTPFQTAWALLGLMAAGRVHSKEVRRGIRYLLRTQNEDGLWHHPWFTAPGFPRVFYLKYHGYCAYFPLWALARYGNLVADQHQRSA